MDDQEKISQSRTTKKTPRKKKETEVEKPWGKKERLLVFSSLLLTAGISAILAINNQSPGLKFPTFQNINFKTTLSSLDNKSRDENQIVNPTPVEDKVITDFRNRTQNLAGIYGFYLYDTNTKTGLGLLENQPFPLNSFATLLKKDTISSREVQIKIESLDMLNTFLDTNLTTPQDMAKLGASLNKKASYYSLDVSSNSFLKVKNSQIIVIMSSGSLKSEADNLFKEYENF